MERPKILGILNITEDSFSDGGKFLDPKKAFHQVEFLRASGADILDIGAQSSNIHAEPVPWEIEWERIRTIGKKTKEKALRTEEGERFKLSIDSFRPEILEKCLEMGIDYWNDITALRDPKAVEILASNKENIPELILMFSHNRGDRAIAKSNLDPKTIVDDILKFFDQEVERLLKFGIPGEKIIFDPGMGFFLGENPWLSVAVLKEIPRLKKELGQVLVSVSRKSFLGNLLGGLPPDERNIPTLISELFIANLGVDYIRTHEPKPLLQSIKTWNALNQKIV